MTVLLIINSMLILSLPSPSIPGWTPLSLKGIILESRGASSVVVYDNTCLQNEMYDQKPSSKSSSGRLDIGVGNVFWKFPNVQVNTWVDYLDSILVCSSGFLLASIYFSASLFLESKFTCESGWNKQSSRMKVYFMPSSLSHWSWSVPSWRHGPVPLDVVKLLFVWRSDPGMNLQISLQICPVIELSQTKNTESVSKWIWVLSFSELPLANEVVNPWSELRGCCISCLKSPLE